MSPLVATHTISYLHILSHELCVDTYKYTAAKIPEFWTRVTWCKEQHVVLNNDAADQVNSKLADVSKQRDRKKK